MLVLEKRKVGKLEFTEHNAEMGGRLWDKKRRKLKAERNSGEKFKTTQTGQLRGKPCSLKC